MCIKYWDNFVSLRKCITGQTLKWIRVYANSNTHERDLSLACDNLYPRKKFSCAKNLFYVKMCSSKSSNVFIDCQVLICNVHREQAREMWQNATKNSAEKDGYRSSTLLTSTSC